MVVVISTLRVVVDHYTHQLQGGSVREARSDARKTARVQGESDSEDLVDHDESELNSDEDADEDGGETQRMEGWQRSTQMAVQRVHAEDDDGEDPPRKPTYEETLHKCREIIDSASSGLEGGQLALARLAYAAIIDSGFEDWSGEIFEWSEGWEEPSDVLTAWHAALEANVEGFDLCCDGDMLDGGEAEWMDTTYPRSPRSPMTQEQLDARRREIMQVSECVLISRCSVVISTLPVLISTLPVLISTGSVLISTLPVLISTESVLISTDSVLISTGSVLINTLPVLISTGSVLISTGNVLITTLHLLISTHSLTCIISRRRASSCSCVIGDRGDRGYVVSIHSASPPSSISPSQQRSKPSTFASSAACHAVRTSLGSSQPSDHSKISPLQSSKPLSMMAAYASRASAS